MANENPLSELSDALAEAAAFAGRSTVMVNARRRIPGSGIAIAPDLVLTADHVVEREEDLRVLLNNQEEVHASLAGRDPGSDLALLRLETAAAEPAVPTSQEARVGQLVLAIARPAPHGIQASLGVITSTGSRLRTGRGSQLERYLTTDAIPYPGFSGGPLVDSRGHVQGLNTSGLTRGASLAIPADLAWRLADILGQHGRVRYGYLGIRSQPVQLPEQTHQHLGREQSSGLLVVGVEADSPASQAGLMIGDILTAISGTPLEEPEALTGSLTGELVGQTVPLELLRGGQPASLEVTVAERPARPSR